jgi:hypothetical protein
MPPAPGETNVLLAVAAACLALPAAGWFHAGAMRTMSLVLLASALGACSSDKVCTTIGCVDGFSLSFGAGAKTAGSYVIDLDADGKKVRCEAKLPLPPCEQAQTSCNDPSVSLELSGCALDASEHAISGLRVSGKPAKVVVSVNRDNLQLLTEEFTPAYTTSTPNGADCPPVCTQASASLTIP